MATNAPNSPRQKMINLMYLVFIAMLALNVSAEVLEGFDVVDSGLRSSTENLDNRNVIILNELKRYNNENPEKAGEWYSKALTVKEKSDSLVNYIEDLKFQMVEFADGKKANVNDIKKKDDTEAAGYIMLSPINSNARKMRSRIDIYKNEISELVISVNSKKTIERSLLTENSKSSASGKNWEQSLFENMPLSASVTLLSKIQNDIRNAEGEALSDLLNSVDFSDFRVNMFNAYVVPETDVVIQGGEYRGKIILSAEDSTMHPKIYLGNKSIKDSDNGVFSIPTSSTGVFTAKGFVEVLRGDGTVMKKEFSKDYSVIEPMATVASTMMNVLYAGIDNEISISVPGISQHDISATMTNGSLVKKGNMWVARPKAVGEKVEISVMSKQGNRARQMSKKEFRVRSLPDPKPFIEYVDNTGNMATFSGGGIPKSALVKSDGIKAAIDDGILNIPFKVKGFRTIFFDAMGNAIPELSEGDKFSTRQKQQISRLSRGKYFYISGVKAIGPDGVEREISVIEVRVQ